MHIHCKDMVMVTVTLKQRVIAAKYENFCGKYYKNHIMQCIFLFWSHIQCYGSFELKFLVSLKYEYVVDFNYYVMFNLVYRMPGIFAPAFFWLKC